MAKDFAQMEDSNRSANLSLHEVSTPERRQVLLDGLGLSLGALFGPLAGCAALPGRGPVLGFTPVPASSADRVTVPEGYSATVLAPWGEPVGIAGQMPAFKPDASNTAAEQALQMGMNHDGLQYYPLDGSIS
jgi:secreted PhoX family phosphatase